MHPVRKALLLPAALLLTAAAPATTAARQTLAQYAHAQIAAALDEVQSTNSTAFAAARLKTLLQQIALSTGDKSPDALRETAFALRLVSQLADVPENERGELLRFLRTNDNLAHALAFAITDSDKPGKVYALLQKLHAKFPDKLDAYANLAAAVCTVHARPLHRHVNENLVTAPGPADIFDYFATNEKAMLFGVKNVPPELLAYVVDVTSPIDELTWAQHKYAGDQSVTRHFFDVPYDWAYYRTGKDKKLDKAGFSLQNILKLGGVCADQAYFAAEIGKAIGVPTAVATGESGEVGHAWVGFLENRAGKGAWNFDVGRYEEYKGIRGNVQDPQARQDIPDAYVSLLAEMIEVKPADRLTSIALTDAAAYLLAADKPDVAPLPENITDAAKPRPANTETALLLLESAVNHNPGNPQPWFLVISLAKDNRLLPQQKARWSETVMKLCGNKYPDFATAVLEPIIAGVDEPAEQNRLWNIAFTKFQNRADLAASIRMKQAKLWEKSNQPARAGQCYLDVIDRYANAGPFVITALNRAESLLKDSPDKVLALYDQTFRKIEKPADLSGPFIDQSNWYQVGMAYADRLRTAGKIEKADALAAQLKAASSSSTQ